MLRKLGFLCLLTQGFLSASNAHACGCPHLNAYHSLAPQAVGEIPDQAIFDNGTDCGPNALVLDVTPYFDSFGKPLTYCLSNMRIEGDVSNLNVTLNPFTGMLNIPVGWFGVSTTVYLTIIVKNPYGSAVQHMKVYLDPCGG